MKIGIGNIIAPDVELPENIEIGNYNVISKGVRFEQTSPLAKICIGDCNILNEGVKLVIGQDNLTIGDWNVFHNQLLIIALGEIEIGHNCWFGQNTILDGSGGLTIGNGVRVGMYSQIWSHVGSGERLEGCLLYGFNPTVIENDVWLVGSCIVASGAYLREKTICLTSSFIQGTTEPKSTYSGNPAKKQDKIRLWINPSINEKFAMMTTWCSEFCTVNFDLEIEVLENSLVLTDKKDVVIIGKCDLQKTLSGNETYFNLSTKTYTKKLTELERKFYKYLYNNKARFIPI